MRIRPQTTSQVSSKTMRCNLERGRANRGQHVGGHAEEMGVDVAFGLHGTHKHAHHGGVQVQHGRKRYKARKCGDLVSVPGRDGVAR